MYISYLHNCPTSKLGNITYNSKLQIVTSYLEVCELIGADPDKLYEVKDVEDFSIDDLAYMLSIVTCYNNILSVYSLNSIVKTWFNSPIDKYPFNNTSPLAFMSDNEKNILKTRFYTNSLIVHLREAFNIDG